jgi:hypothetical protein
LRSIRRCSEFSAAYVGPISGRHGDRASLFYCAARRRGGPLHWRVMPPAALPRRWCN